MILAFNFKNAIREAHLQAEETGYRQKIHKRRIVNRTWWTVEQLDERVTGIGRPALPRVSVGSLIARLEEKRRGRLVGQGR